MKNAVFTRGEKEEHRVLMQCVVTMRIHHRLVLEDVLLGFVAHDFTFPHTSTLFCQYPLDNECKASSESDFPYDDATIM